MYIHSLKIKNLRCFEQTELTFQYPGRQQDDPPQLPNINLLLGNNGAGKTTVLKAIALGTLAPILPQSGLVPYWLVRQTTSPNGAGKRAEINANLVLHSQDTGEKPTDSDAIWPMKIMIERIRNYESLLALPPPVYSKEGSFWPRMFEDQSSAFLVLGYGATRRVEYPEKLDPSARRRSRLLRYDRVAGLFESQISLIPLGLWLPQFREKKPGRYKQVVHLVSSLLPEGASFTGEFVDGEYLFEVEGLKTVFSALSDGYQSYIGWIGDLLYHICMGARSGKRLVDNRGIVMVDEIDLHLHPEWQRSVIARISEALPNLQFIFTTHSPIVTGSLNRENIYVMETTETGASVVKQYDEQVYGLSAEEVLLSSYFKLRTTRAEPFVDELKELSVRAGKGDLKAALKYMEKLAGQENGSSANGGSIKKPKTKAGRKANTKNAGAKNKKAK
ncbi:MAG: AAA family ATPase [Blastocatellales bacterium]